MSSTFWKLQAFRFFSLGGGGEGRREGKEGNLDRTLKNYFIRIIFERSFTIYLNLKKIYKLSFLFLFFPMHFFPGEKIDFFL